MISEFLVGVHANMIIWSCCYIFLICQMGIRRINNFFDLFAVVIKLIILMFCYFIRIRRSVQLYMLQHTVVKQR